MKRKKSEEEEKAIRKELDLLPFLVLLRISRSKRQMKHTYNNEKKRDIIKRIENDKEMLKHIDRCKVILDNILETTEILKTKDLPKEKKQHFTQRREEFRMQFTEELQSEINRVIKGSNLPSIVKKVLLKDENNHY